MSKLKMVARKTPKTAYTILSSHVTPTVIFSKKAIFKTEAYIEVIDKEVGWLGVINYNKENNSYLVEDVLMFEQNTSVGTTEIQADTLAKFAEELIMQEDGLEIWNKILLWGHSHGNMGVTPSGQDDSMMNVFSDNSTRFVRVIGNKKGDMKVDVYDYEAGISYIDVAWRVEEVSATVNEKLEKEISETDKKINDAYEKLELELKSEINKLSELTQQKTLLLTEEETKIKESSTVEVKEKVKSMSTTAGVVTTYYDGRNNYSKKKEETKTGGSSHYQDSVIRYQRNLTVEKIHEMFTQQQINILATDKLPQWARNEVFRITGNVYITFPERQALANYIVENNMFKNKLNATQRTAWVNSCMGY